MNEGDRSKEGRKLNSLDESAAFNRSTLIPRDDIGTSTTTSTAPQMPVDNHKPALSAKSACIYCSIAFTGSVASVQCEGGCQGWVCFPCIENEGADSAKLAKLSNPARSAFTLGAQMVFDLAGISFKCNSCLSSPVSSEPPISDQAATIKIQATTIQQQMELVQDLIRKNSDLSDKIATLSMLQSNRPNFQFSSYAQGPKPHQSEYGQPPSFAQVVMSSRDPSSTLRPPLGALGPRHPIPVDHPVPPPSVREYYNSGDQLAEKSKNAVIVNLPEQKSEDETLANDQRTVDGWVKRAKLDMSDLVGVRRHAKSRDGRPRIMKVTFSSRDVRDQFLGRFWSVRDEEEKDLSPAIYARRDLTVPELKFDRDLRSYVHEENDKTGERRLTVRDLSVCQLPKPWYPYKKRRSRQQTGDDAGDDAGNDADVPVENITK